MKREQVLLKPETILEIEEMAKSKSISKSAVIRQIIDDYLSLKFQTGLNDDDFVKNQISVRFKLKKDWYFGKAKIVY